MATHVRVCPLCVFVSRAVARVGGQVSLLSELNLDHSNRFFSTADAFFCDEDGSGLPVRRVAGNGRPVCFTKLYRPCTITYGSFVCISFSFIRFTKSALDNIPFARRCCFGGENCVVRPVPNSSFVLWRRRPLVQRCGSGDSTFPLFFIL